MIVLDVEPNNTCISHVYESIYRIMTGVNECLNANTIEAVIKRCFGTVIEVYLQVGSLTSPVSFFTACHIHLPCIWKMDASKSH